MVRKCGREARAGARREGIRSSTRLRPRPSVRGELGQGGGGLQGGAPVGMTSSSHPKMPCSPINKSPNLQGKHEQKKKSLVRKRNPTARRGHLHPRRPLYSHCLAWSMRPYASSLHPLFDEREDATERKPRGRGSSQAAYLLLDAPHAACKAPVRRGR